MAKKKATDKSKVSKKKAPMSQDDLRIRDEFENEMSLVDVRGKNCIVSLPKRDNYPQDIDNDLGLIALLELKGLDYIDINIKDPEEILFIYPKGEVTKIKVLEKAYSSNKIQVDAKDIADLTMLHVNALLALEPAPPRIDEDGRHKLVSNWKKKYHVDLSEFAEEELIEILETAFTYGVE